MAVQNKKVIRYKKKKNRKNKFWNAGVVVFFVIFLYLIFTIYKSNANAQIQTYEVREGDIVSDYSFSGLIIREEKIIYTDTEGYINYYIREKKKGAVGSLIYSIDENGEYSNLLMNAVEDEYLHLNDEQSASLKKQLNQYITQYSDMEFDHIYDVRTSLDNALLESVQLEELQEITGNGAETISLKQYQLAESGIVVYSTDGYEELSLDKINEDTFDIKSYTKTKLSNSRKVGIWEPAYKLITSDKWSVVFPLQEGDKEFLSSLEQIQAEFKTRNLQIAGTFGLFTGADGKEYGRLDFSDYAVAFASDRFVDFEVCVSKAEGLKIPKSSVVQKEVYKIPVQYIAQGANSQSEGFYKEIYTESGTETRFITGTVYKQDDEYYYMECDELAVGDYLVKPKTNDRYAVTLTESLDGVYSVNKGYAVFKRINIIDENGEYYIVQKNIYYGISPYDTIVLNGGLVMENDIVY